MNKADKKKFVLYRNAQAADIRLNRACRPRNRWTLTANDLMRPNVREALKKKFAADDAWLEFMRASRIKSIAVNPDARD